MITIIKFISTSIIVTFCACVCVVRTVKIYSLSIFQTYSTVWLTLVIMLYIRSLELTHLKTENLPIFSDPQPLATTGLLSGTMSLAFLDSISEIIQCLSSRVWLLSLSIMSSRFVHIVANGRIFSFFILE